MSEPLWLPKDEVIATNKKAVAETGEPFFVRDHGLLESALAKPQQHYYYGGEIDVVSLASVLLFGIARNHAFEQGNKRTGFLSAILFLELNGYMLTIADTDLLGKHITLVIEGELPEASFVQTLQHFVTECGEPPLTWHDV